MDSSGPKTQIPQAKRQFLGVMSRPIVKYEERIYGEL